MNKSWRSLPAGLCGWALLSLALASPGQAQVSKAGCAAYTSTAPRNTYIAISRSSISGTAIARAADSMMSSASTRFFAASSASASPIKRLTENGPEDFIRLNSRNRSRWRPDR